MRVYIGDEEHQTYADTMGVQMTAEQFRQLLATIVGNGGGGGGQAAGAAAVVGPMQHCHLGKDKIRRYKRWGDWIQDAENKMKFLQITTSQAKIGFIRSCAGAELSDFWTKEARIRFEDIPADQPRGVLAQDAHTYDQIKDESKKSLLKMVSRDRAIIDLLRLEQGTRNFIDFLSEVEDQEHLCRTEEMPLNSHDMQRMSLIAGMKDRTLAEKAIAEEYTLKQVIQAGVNRESSKANVEAMQARPHTNVHRVEDKLYQGGDMDARINYLQAELEDVMKIRKSGKYSGRTSSSQEETKGDKCKKCTYEHGEGRCPAEGRKCNICNAEGHFARSPLCTASTTTGNQRKATTRRVEDRDNHLTDASSDSEQEEVKRVNMVEPLKDRAWPGVQGHTVRTQHIQLVEEIRQVQQARPGKKRSRHVWVRLGGHRVKLYCDTGSRLTIIPPELYREEMGEVVAARCHLRAWGSDKYLDTKGMFKTTIKAAGGANKVTWVYVVGGTRPEPLLGDEDAEDLGVISFHPEGRQETVIKNISVPDRLRKTGITVDTEKKKLYNIPEAGRTEAAHIVHEYTGSVFTDRIGNMQVPPIVLQYERGFKPTQPPRYSVPYHYQDKLAAHLQQLTKEGVIEDVHPAEPIDCILNLSISEKKTKGSIRMNIDARPLNKGAKHTKYHVPLPQEVRHQLEGARVYSELDMGNAFHQVPLQDSSHCVFQSHKGLHRMKRLFFGPTNSTGIFHHEVSKAFAGVRGCITIHDNLLIYGRDVEEHNTNLRATLARAKLKGVTLKLSKSTICATEVKWFGRIFSGCGVSADPDKIQHIIQAGRPDTVEDVRSLLQAAAYNARFAFDHKGAKSYEEVTSPLREMLGKGAQFSWTREREDSFQLLLKMMNDKAYLAPYNPAHKTHLVTDASPWGISASIYQEDTGGKWLPVDHITRALSPQEQRWRSQIDWESLAKSWGIMMFRPYLLGNKFTSLGDHQPLTPLYN